MIHKIVVRPPQMSGSHSGLTPVSWKFKIQRHQGEFEGPTHTSIIYTSTWQTAQGSTTAAAYLGSGFTSRTATLNEDAGNAQFADYRVIVQMRWSNHGRVEGSETFRYDWYQLTMGSDSRIFSGLCTGIFPEPG